MTSGTNNPAERRGLGACAYSWEASHNSHFNRFRAAIAAAGLAPPADIEPGRWIRFPGLKKGASNRAGWCYLFPDKRAGAFGCWASGLSGIWHAERRHFTREERAAFRRQMAEAKRQAEREQAEAWGLAAARAGELWRNAQPASPEHPYLTRKGVAPYCARQSGQRLVLPIVGWDGALSSLQFIAPDGKKLMLKGGRKRDRFIHVHGQSGAGRILIAEGFATAATLAEAEPAAMVLAAVDMGNLRSVAVAARKHDPDAEIVVCADADAAGQSMARAAAVACGGLVAVPEFPPGAKGSDFNDLAALSRQGGER